jgi:hypothetical protein
MLGLAMSIHEDCTDLLHGTNFTSVLSLEAAPKVPLYRRLCTITRRLSVVGYISKPSELSGRPSFHLLHITILWSITPDTSYSLTAAQNILR